VVAVTIPDGQPFRIALADDVPITAKEGQILSFRVLEDLKIAGNAVILRGAAVTGSIASEGAKKRFLGMGSKMRFQLASVDGADGKKLRVRAGGGTIVLDTGRYAKPKDLAAVRGTDYIAYVDGEQTVSLHK
jgi:hypothetical protein